MSTFELTLRHNTAVAAQYVMNLRHLHIELDQFPLPLIDGARRFGVRRLHEGVGSTGALRDIGRSHEEIETCEAGNSGDGRDGRTHGTQIETAGSDATTRATGFQVLSCKPLTLQ